MTQYVGKQTTQALANFPFSAPPVHKELVYGIAIVKKAAARANKKIGALDPAIADAIEKAADEVVAGKLDDQFTLPSLQGGAGTSINMNVNEVLAARAQELLGGKVTVHPNDHVNMAQSTNDVNPSALKLVCLELGNKLVATLEETVAAFHAKSLEFADVHKLGRTHLQDAVPITLGDEFAAYEASLARGVVKIKQALTLCTELNLGGTAVGNAINASKEYRKAVYEELSAITKQPVVPAANLMSQTSSQTDFVSLSHALLSFTLDASKIATDLRLMASGPAGGLGEIQLAELAAGSSIMPGKVNPILPESVNQLYFTVSGNSLTIEHAAQASLLELGIMFPMLADRLISSLKLTSEVMGQFTKQCVVSIKANKARCLELLERSTAYATLLTPKLGYDVVSAAVKESIKEGKTIREVIVAKKLLTTEEFDAIVSMK